MKVVQKASESSSQGIIKNIADLKLSITGELEKVEDSLFSEFKRLSEIQQAIKIEKENLEELYQLSANTDSLAAILLAQKEKKRLFEEEMAQKEKDLMDRINSERQKFDEEMGIKKTNWDKEKKEYELTFKEVQAEEKKKRQREEDEYIYKLKVERQKEEDEYLSKKEKLEKELAEQKASFEKEIKERELQIKTSEDELSTLRKQSEAFPKELGSKIKEAEDAVRKELSTKYNFEKELFAKDVDGQLKLKDKTITSLEAKIKEQDTLIKQTGLKADTAEKTVKDIAIKAIESASKVQVFEQGRKAEKMENADN